MAARSGTQTFHRTARDREDPGKDRVHAEEREGVAELKIGEATCYCVIDVFTSELLKLFTRFILIKLDCHHAPFRF